LIENEKIPTRRFYITGHAYNQPLRPNNTIKNRAVNRRVEIILTKERPSGQTGSWE
jgi:chemotaxis protein MotB